jgi:hypothetical protein
LEEAAAFEGGDGGAFGGGAYNFRSYLRGADV